MIYLIAFACSLIVSFALTPLMRKLALRYGIIDRPISAVKTHKTPVPYLGGVAIWASFVLILFIVRFYTHFPTGTLRNLRGIFIGGTIIMFLGLVDDIKGLDFKIKFLAQVVGAIILMLFDIRIKFISHPLLSSVLTIIWVVGITNALNIIDIMDGLSSGISVIACLAFFFVALPTEQIYVNFASCVLAGSCLGFLRYNFKPARIFMGDAGSLFCGFILAAISLGESYTTINNIALLAPVFILGIPIYDTALVSLFRFRKGKSIFLGSKDHFALRLEAMGHPRGRVVFIAYLISAMLGVTAFLITVVKFEIAVLIYALIVGLAILFGAILGGVEVK